MNIGSHAVASALEPARRRKRWPARLDWLQSASGLLLALFMWGHMFFVSSILLGKDAMWTVTRFFEGYFFFGRAYPGLVSVVVAGVLTLFVMHAMLALRKFPINYRQYRAFADHKQHMRHDDTTLWWWQVLTGFALFFLASMHLYVMLSQPVPSARIRAQTASGATTTGRCTWCCCSRWKSTAASAFTGCASSGAGSRARTTTPRASG